MTYKTHVSLGFATSLSVAFLPNVLNPFMYISNIEVLPFLVFFIFLASLAPDFDEPNSYLSKQFPWVIISMILSSFFKHRGGTHYLISSLIFALLISIIGFIILKNEVFNYWYLLPFLIIPYIAHSIGDGCTKGGVPRFYYPFSKKTYWTLPKQLRFYTGSFTENIYFIIISSIVILEVVYILKFLNPPFLNIIHITN